MQASNKTLAPADIPAYIKFLQNEKDPKGRRSILSHYHIWKIVQSQRVIQCFAENRGFHILNEWMNDAEAYNDEVTQDEIRRKTLRFLMMGRKQWYNIAILESSGIIETLKGIARNRKTDAGLYVLSRDFLDKFGRASKIPMRTVRRKKKVAKGTIRFNDADLVSTKLFSQSDIVRKRGAMPVVSVGSNGSRTAQGYRPGQSVSPRPGQTTARRGNAFAQSLKRKPTKLPEVATSSNNYTNVSWYTPPRFAIKKGLRTERGSNSTLSQEWAHREFRTPASPPISRSDEPLGPPPAASYYNGRLEDVPEIKSLHKKFLANNAPNAAPSEPPVVVDYGKLYDHVTDEKVRASKGAWAAANRGMVIEPPPPIHPPNRSGKFSPRVSAGSVRSARGFGYNSSRNTNFDRQNFRGNQRWHGTDGHKWH